MNWLLHYYSDLYPNPELFETDINLLPVYGVYDDSNTIVAQSNYCFNCLEGDGSNRKPVFCE
jgi:hypothetical protein